MVWELAGDTGWACGLTADQAGHLSSLSLCLPCLKWDPTGLSRPWGQEPGKGSAHLSASLSLDESLAMFALLRETQDDPNPPEASESRSHRAVLPAGLRLPMTSVQGLAQDPWGQERACRGRATGLGTVALCKQHSWVSPGRLLRAYGTK